MTELSTELGGEPSTLKKRGKASFILKALFAVISLTVVASLFSMYRRVTHNKSAVDVSGIKLFKVTKCLPDLEDDNKASSLKKIEPLRFAEEEWYCSNQWDEAYFSSAARVLQHNGLLMSQLQRMQPDDPDPYKNLPVSAANFIKVVEVAPLLGMDAESLQEIKNQQGVPLPEPDKIAEVAAAIDINRSAAVANPLPQAYQLKSANPAIRLITNIGLNYSLRELSEAVNNEWQPDPELEKTAAVLKTLTGDDSTVTDILQSKNPLMSLVGLEELMYLYAAKVHPEYLFRTHTLPEVPRPDLDMIVLNNPTVFASVPFLGDRDGYFDYKNSRIYAKVDSVQPLPARGEIDQKITTAKFMAAQPASLEHEFFHYLFFRPSISFSGFIVEGEATAYGEYEHQMFATGAQSGDEMAELSIKALSPKGATKQETERLNELVNEETLSSQPTAVQCDCALSVYQTNVAPKTPIPLASLLTLTTPLFQSGDSAIIRTRYAQAWSVYHVDLVRQKGWGKQLENIATKLKLGQEATDQDKALLASISNETLDWIAVFIKGRKKECENLLRTNRFPGKQ